MSRSAAFVFCVALALLAYTPGFAAAEKASGDIIGTWAEASGGTLYISPVDDQMSGDYWVRTADSKSYKHRYHRLEPAGDAEVVIEIQMDYPPMIKVKKEIRLSADHEEMTMLTRWLGIPLAKAVYFRDIEETWRYQGADPPEGYSAGSDP